MIPASTIFNEAMQRQRTDQARRTFAQRSLAHEYTQWRQQVQGLDLLKKLEQEPNARAKSGTVKEFLSMNPSYSQDVRKFEVEIHHGLWMLRIERHFGNTIISAILNFRPSYLAKVKRDEVESLCTAVRRSGWMMALMDEVSDWLETCQAKYEGMLGSLGQGDGSPD